MGAVATTTLASSEQKVRTLGERDPADGPSPLPRVFASDRSATWEQLLGAPVRWPRPSRLGDPLEVSAGKLADGLRTLGLSTVGELLEHLPRDSRDARTVAGLTMGEGATVAVQVRAIASRQVRRAGMKPLVEAIVFDETGSMPAMFFNQPWLLARYTPGTKLVLHGKITGRGMFNVAHHAVGNGLDPHPTQGEADPPDALSEVAHYPAAEGVSSTQILALVQGVKDALKDVPEALEAATRVGEKLPDRAAALAAMHFPRTASERERGRERLAFEELLLTQLVFLRRRARRRARKGALALDGTSSGESSAASLPALSERWLESGLPFQLTDDQRRAIATIRADLAQERAMQRLLLGEVGSGKTVVALYALLRAVEHGHQAALMAPTETLAEQHFATLQRLLGTEQVRCALLTGSTSARKREDTLGKLASGELSLIVGTHALIEPDVRFRALAVAVVDEQHRFGVRQRAALDGKGIGDPPTRLGPDGSVREGPSGDRSAPHVLHMTATPIPRTLALANYGDLDVTVLRELPQGRQTIETCIVAGETVRAHAYEQLRAQLGEGRQAYVVCPLIEQAEDGDGAADMRAVTAELERLRMGELRDHCLVLLHGGMRAKEKALAMAQFASGQADVLVATTVIEVGVDVPNATVMLIENAERFGISQLHQLRGRIGRGVHGGRCFLGGPPSSARLRALVECSDGFKLAEIDLEMRKEGELIGTRQSGVGQFQVACLPADAALLERARARAETIMAVDPSLQAPEHALLGYALERTFGEEALEPIPG